MDRTGEAVRRQIAAMGCRTFEIGLFRANATMILLTFDSDGVLKSLPRFRFENCQGGNVFIRPDGEHNLSMVDDLNVQSIRRMKVMGLSPALVVETSPGNFQAWIKHSRVLPKELSTAVARRLAKDLGGDAGAADWRHFGRLAGFTNRKLRHQGSDGLFPFVKLVEASSRVCDAAEGLVAQVQLQMEEEVKRRTRMRRTGASHRLSHSLKTIDQFRANPIYAGDATRGDLAYAIYALSLGASVEQVEATIAARDLSHKGGEKRQADYLARTIKKALTLVQTR